MSAVNESPNDAAVGVRDAHQRWWNGLLTADAAALDTLLPDDFFICHTNGSSSTKTEILVNLDSGRLKYDSIEDETPLIRIYGQTGIVTGRVDIQFQWERRPILVKLYYTAVYGWTAPQWRLLALQETARAETEG